jgi:hypothetical protein
VQKDSHLAIDTIFASLSRRELVIYDKHPSGDMASPRSQNHNAQAAMENRRRYPNHE